MGNEERAKLRTMLNYWIAHNEEHSQEFREWADKAKGFGEAEAGEQMLQAVREMDKASELLSQALKGLEKRSNEMCLSKAYVDRNGETELVMEQIASVKIEDDRLLLRALFGEQKEIGADVKQVDFLSHSIFLKKVK